MAVDEKPIMVAFFGKIKSGKVLEVGKTAGVEEVLQFLRGMERGEIPEGYDYIIADRNPDSVFVIEGAGNCKSAELTVTNGRLMLSTELPEDSAVQILTSFIIKRGRSLLVLSEGRKNPAENRSYKDRLHSKETNLLP